MTRASTRPLARTALALALLCPATTAGAESSEEYSVRMYTERAKGGDVEAQRTLGALYSNGQWVEKNPKQAFHWFGKAAEQGDVQSQAMMGQALEAGDGVKADPKKARAWYVKAAKQGSQTGMYNAGRLYREEGDLARALVWFHRADEAGMPQARQVLDALKEAGELAKLPPKERLERYEADAEGSDAAAQFALGKLYLQGEGKLRDPEKGIEYLEKAAEQGNTEAQAALGVVYDQGIGVDPDPERAVEWYEKAAAAGDAKSRFNLAVIYRHGQGVPENTPRALMWLVLASEENYSARYMLYDLERQLSEEELRVGREMAASWRPPAGR